ncbi:SMP-30/gluconolactonase/LRE family protein [bacterium SCSIO 12696]|nr:SMP-30/gluconolactonase/LRE family protein [bacterium SCSIO 12696]
MNRLLGKTLLLATLLWATSPAVQAGESLVAEGALPERLAMGFSFTEGPSVDRFGNIYFSDIPNSRIYKWSVEEKRLSLFHPNTHQVNGTWFGHDGRLYACQWGKTRIVAFGLDGSEDVIADQHAGKPFNRPNDLWMDPKGGIYFTDPNSRDTKPLSQDGEHVFYITPDRSRVIKAADGFKRPNGIIGTRDGKTLYIADRGAKQTWRYRIQPDGRLTDKTFHAAVGSDGMTLDEHGNLYTTTDAVYVYAPDGRLLERIAITPEKPRNVVFGDVDSKTLFITAGTRFLALKMNVAGMYGPHTNDH